MNPKKPPPSPIDVSLDAERLQAQVKVAAAVTVSVEDVLGALRRSGVVYGIVADAVRLALVRREQRVVVARGTPAVAGAPGRIECVCLDAAESASFTPIEDEHGRVDSHGGRVMQTVGPGDVLARLVPPEPGQAGTRVTGEPIAARRGSEVAPVLGPGARLSEDRTQVLATTAGLPNIQGNRLAVLPGCEVKNVDFTTGDIYFVGSVTVCGDVLPGFTVVASEDIQVKGCVEHGTLRAGGKITVAGGISHAAELDAIGDVAVRFVEPQCKIKSGGTIQVRDNALRSTLVARRIIVGHQLVAGSATASELISVGILGNESETHTHLELVRTPVLSEKQAAELAKDHQQERLQTETLLKALHDAGHDAVKLKRLVPLVAAHRLKLRQLDSLASARSAGSADEAASIISLTRTFGGVTATLYGHPQIVSETVGKKTLRFVDGAILVT